MAGVPPVAQDHLESHASNCMFYLSWKVNAYSLFDRLDW